MDTKNTWIDRLQTHSLQWLARGPVSAWVIAGTFAFAGFGAAALGAPQQSDRDTGGTSNVVVSNPHCYANPDGGDIFCDGTVAISSLPASYGYCHTDLDGDVQIVCEGADLGR